VHQLPAVVALDPAELLAGFVPTRRFGHASFETYLPDRRYPSQEQALHRMRTFSSGIDRRPSRLRFLNRARAAARAIYLDGGYGVGKTHLLASVYHATAGQRSYLSFAELAYTISRLGMQTALEAFSGACLVCIDEFELDDVAQTRMAAMFLRQVFEQRAMHVVTTSNTLPSDLGQGRFAADAFQRDIGDIAAAFEIVTIDGEDYRHRRWDDLARPRLLDAAELDRRFTLDAAPERVLVDWPALATQLEQVHPVHYGQIASRLAALYVRGLEPIADQAVALRLAHFVDKLYDQEVRVSVSSAVPLTELFAPSYRHGGYEKKYRRCLSRLHELLSESSSPIGEGIAGQVELG
jgi:cell division protein ZapE